ncbi:MAG: nucleotidyl transferase AbiEii/AbiGii toxin family protein [Myxococcaceae bacterium]
MSAPLPALPDRELLSQLSREAAAREFVQPPLVEKDFYLTRFLWALGEALGEEALLKGGTLLSKVDLGFFRMSEDVDLVLPGRPARTKGSNMQRINVVRDALKRVAPHVGMTIPFPGGTTTENGTHAVWELEYESEFAPGRVRVEATIRPTLERPRIVSLKQLISDEQLGDYTAATCWALDEPEARAEKVRAACTREAIRDFYDLDRLLDAGKDLTSTTFLTLVDAKLAELKSSPLSELRPKPFGLTALRRKKLDESLKLELAAVLRTNAPAFDLDKMLARFELRWTR